MARGKSSGPRTGPAPPHAAAYAERLASGEVPRVLVLAGAEAWFREDLLRTVGRRMFPEGDPGAAMVRLDAKRPEDRERTSWAVDEVRSPSLFGDKKLVAIDGAEAAAPATGAGGGAEGKADPLLWLAGQALAGPPTGSVLVLLTARSVKGKTSIDAEALLSAGATVVDCRPLYDAPGPWEGGAAPWENELARWLVRRMKAVHGKVLSLPDSHAVALRVGTDLGELDGALKTLALSLGTRAEVTAREVEDVLGVTREDPVWHLVDAVLDRNVERALDLAAAAFDRGLSDARGVVTVRPDSLFAMLVATLHSSYRRMLVAAEALARGDAPPDVAKAAGVPPFLAEGFLRRCRRDPADLLARHAAFLEAEAGVKGGGVPPRLAFERLVVRLTAPVPVAP